jgi:hypothetical protein
MTWTGYWTPLRYMLLLKVAALFDEELAQRAWKARIDIDDESSAIELVFVCKNSEAVSPEFVMRGRGS